MRYLSVCSGIEAATQAWHPLGWKPVAFSEIEPFPCAVLDHHYPDVPNWGDMTKFKEWPDADVDVLCGGTPCQSFSVAGLRKGLDDPRGNLMLTFGAIADRYRPKWLVWENVPGVLSSNGGRDFGTFLGMLGQLGYGWAYRTLDAQYVRTCRFPYAVPQRRRRVFVVGYFGDWRRAAAVLFDRESLSGHPAPRRKAGQGSARGFECGPQGGGITDVAPTLDTRCKDGPIRNQLGAGVMCADVAPTINAHFGDKMGLENQRINGGGDCLSPPVANPLTARMHKGINTTLDEGQTLIANGGVFDVAHSLRGEGFDASEDGTGRGTPLVAFSAIDSGHDAQNGVTPMLRKGGDGGQGQAMAIAFDLNQITSKTNRSQQSPAVHHTLPAASVPPHLATPWAVRRLTPVECERLQAFPDDFTRIPYRGKPADRCPDGPRYKALGNSWAVNCAEWVGERIAEVEAWA
jgi:DNA (cytosine-5)-methyltransferase 1